MLHGVNMGNNAKTSCRSTQSEAVMTVSLHVFFLLKMTELSDTETNAHNSLFTQRLWTPRLGNIVQ